MTRTVLLAANTSWYLYNFRRTTIEALLRHDYHVVCIAPPDKYSKQLVDIGASFFPIAFDQASTNPFKEAHIAMRVFILLHRIKPDFAFNFTIKLNIYSGIACALLGIPYANTVSGLGTAFLSRGPIFSLAKRLYRFGNRRADAVFFQNAEDMETFRSRGLVNPALIKVVPGSGIDLIHYAARPMALEGGSFTFVMVARMIADKGIREFVFAAAHVRRMFPATRFLVIGAAGDKNRTAIREDEIVEWKKEGIVEFPGEQEDVRPWLAQAHVLVLPSYREGMPRVVLEAAAMGRPALVSDVPGCRQSIVPGKTGWLCRAKDEQDLTRMMLEVRSTPRLQIAEFGSNARSRMEREFSDTIVVNEYLECLDKRIKIESMHRSEFL